ncbi:MAG TPA: peptidoglycan-binding protein [Blastocatellia bacterium]|nr:peptidoglycan-binding protein [Blastocatellia bacterium]
MRISRSTTLSILVIIILAASIHAGSPPQSSVPAGTQMVLRLDTGISSKTSQVGDRFTASVISPSRFAGAVVEGHIARVEESGRVRGKTELGLAFDSIRFRSGDAAPLDAELLEVRQSESVKVVDEEGNIESGSRGKQSIKRGAIGAAVGGVLGALIGGGKGAVVGILVGGGAGAGSLIIDGSKELRLESGTEMLIRTLRATAQASRGGAFRVNRNLIMDAQRALNEKGYDAGSVDGIMGSQTRAALGRFQRDNNLPVTRRLDRETAERLGITRDN